MANRKTKEERMALHCQVSYMPPSLNEAAAELDANFIGGFRDNILQGNVKGTPRYAQPGDFEYNPAWDEQDPPQIIPYTPPSNADILAKWQELLAAYDLKYYQLEREFDFNDTFGPLAEELDALWHDIDEGKLDKTGSFYTGVKAIKDAHPKS